MKTGTSTVRAITLAVLWGQILNQADNDISVYSVRDCIRLGKLNSSKSRPRPQTTLSQIILHF